jgi:hypothetical protein
MDMWMFFFGTLVVIISAGIPLIQVWHAEVKRSNDWHHRMMTDAYSRGWNEAIEAIKEERK